MQRIGRRRRISIIISVMYSSSYTGRPCRITAIRVIHPYSQWVGTSSIQRLVKLRIFHPGSVMIGLIGCRHTTWIDSTTSQISIGRNSYYSFGPDTDTQITGTSRTGNFRLLHVHILRKATQATATAHKWIPSYRLGLIPLFFPSFECSVCQLSSIIQPGSDCYRSRSGNCIALLIICHYNDIISCRNIQSGKTVFIIRSFRTIYNTALVGNGNSIVVGTIYYLPSNQNFASVHRNDPCSYITGSYHYFIRCRRYDFALYRLYSISIGGILSQTFH